MRDILIVGVAPVAKAEDCYRIMSRSRRKTPRLAFSSSVSEKEDKSAANRQERHAVKAALNETLEVKVAKLQHKRSGGWNFAKDGKRWVKNPDARQMRK